MSLGQEVQGQGHIGKWVILTLGYQIVRYDQTMTLIWSSRSFLSEIVGILISIMKWDTDLEPNIFLFRLA